VNTYFNHSFLAHFPVRDSQQIIRKCLTAIDGLIRKKSRLPGEGFHVYDNLRKIIFNEFKLSLQDLQKIANEYAEKIAPIEIHLSDFPLWINNYELKYQNISDADHTKYLAEIIINLWKNPLPDIDLIELQKNLYFN